MRPTCWSMVYQTIRGSTLVETHHRRSNQRFETIRLELVSETQGFMIGLGQSQTGSERRVVYRSFNLVGLLVYPFERVYSLMLYAQQYSLKLC